MILHSKIQNKNMENSKFSNINFKDGDRKSIAKGESNN